MGVKPGYKQTELGVFPEEWELKPFGDLFDFSGGFSASREQLSKEGHCYLHYGDIHGATKTWVDAHADFQDIPKLDIPLKKVSPRSLLEDGDVVFVDASEDEEGTSRHVVVVNKGNLPFISGLHTIVAKSKTDELTHEYRRYCFQTAAIKQQFRFYAVGTKVSGISKSNIPKLLLPFPKPAEQRAIAAALSDMDVLLGGMDRLITKKHDLKQATMQQLLTGQTRLPGFSGEWEVKQARHAGRCLRGVSYQGESDLFNNDTKHSKRLLRANNVQNATVLTNDVQFVNAARVSPHQVLRPDDILICMANGSKDLVGKAGLFAINDGYDYTFGAFMGCFRTDTSAANPHFVFFLLQTGQYRNYINNLLAGSSINNLRPSIIESLEFGFPTLPEQTAISAVLSDMDAELAVLEARRDKTIDLKQAMMQELLTGRKRLVPWGAAYA